MTGVSVCPECQSTLPNDAPQGLCPRCLLQQGVAAVGDRRPGVPARPLNPPVPAVLARRFPQLEILEPLGQGSTGLLYKARQLRLDRLVTLQLFPSETAAPGFVERFLHAARVLARLHHPNLFQVYDFGENDGEVYLIAEFVDGVTVRHLLEAGPLPPDQALRLVPQLCAAVQYAHEQGGVHLDVQPENLVVDSRGQVKIAAPALARLSSLTPGSGEADPRTVVHTLGGTLYEMLTGALPPERGSAASGSLAPRIPEPESRPQPQPVNHLNGAVVPPAPNALAAPDATWDTALTEIALRDLGATLGILGGLLAIGLAIALTNEPTPLWGLCLIVWLASDFPWATQFKAIAGVLGIAGTLALIGFAVWWTHSAGPLVAIILLIWFATSFPWQSQQQATIESGQSLGLSATEQRVRQALSAYTGDDELPLTLLPEIPSEQLTRARKTAQVPPAERILALVDLTYDESGRHNLVFGSSSIYFYNPEESRCPGAGLVRYYEFPARTFINHGVQVYLGKEQYLCPESDWCDYYTEGCEKIAQMLNAVGQAFKT